MRILKAAAPNHQWKIELIFGPGAGYMNPVTKRRGYTAFIAWKAGYHKWHKSFRGMKLPFLWPLSFGLTLNANKVPWLSY